MQTDLIGQLIRFFVKHDKKKEKELNYYWKYSIVHLMILKFNIIFAKYIERNIVRTHVTSLPSLKISDLAIIAMSMILCPNMKATVTCSNRSIIVPYTVNFFVQFFLGCQETCERPMIKETSEVAKCSRVSQQFLSFPTL